MARRTFFSFHYKPDCWRASQVRNMGKVEGNAPLSDNDWEAVKRGGDKAIKAWIDKQLHGRSCTVVLIGGKTAGRKWIKYEIEESWDAGKGVLGIYIHNLADSNGNQSQIGRNPFDDIKCEGGKKLSTIVKVYDPRYKTSSYVYNFIKENIADWVEEAIQIRNSY